MYWADELAASAVDQGAQVVNDSKTPSGTVHVGSLRGVVLHDAIARALADAGVDAVYRYGVDDMDPMDNQALLSGDAVDRYMGAPLCRVPDPEGDCHASYARHFAERFLEIFAGLGVEPDVYWMSDLYADGSMDQWVRQALDRAGAAREVYAGFGIERSDEWLPIQVVCERCGKVGTTWPTEWDGETVAYECRPDLVRWARGCGNHGRLSPFGGRAKLLWNFEWAAQWSLLDVRIEGCGKDLATAGGSRDRSDAISRAVFDREPPINVPYEFLNVGGRKMSTSKGQGAAAHEMADLLPPELLRFLFLRQPPRRAIDFDPAGDTVPGLFDEFDRVAGAVAGRETRGQLPPDPERILRMSLVAGDVDVVAEASRYRPPFRHLALLAQVPGVDVEARVGAEKGSALDEAERRILHDRLRVARAWLASFAPERYRIEVQHDQLPEAVQGLSGEQRRFLQDLSDLADEREPGSGDAWQDLIYGAAQDAGLASTDAFTAVYAAFLGRTSGPRAGWLLASLPPVFVKDRLAAASLGAAA